MRAKKKQEKAMDGLLKLLAAQGVDEETLKKAKETVPEPHDAVSLQGEAVLIYLEKPARFTIKRCKWCNESFGTNYRNVSYCSDNHRAKALYQKTGLRWDSQTAKEARLRYDPTLVIPPDQIEVLRKFALSILEQYDQQDQPVKIVAGKPYRTNPPASSEPEQVRDEQALGMRQFVDQLELQGVDQEHAEQLLLALDSHTNPVEAPLSSTLFSLEDLGDFDPYQ